MALQTPYIGSKISLISKIGIRYEGVLYMVDPKELTVALAKVRCYGTEDRPSLNPIGRREDVFEYVVFKATDITDLVVCEAPKPMVQFGNGLPYDPAIVKLSNAQPKLSTNEGSNFRNEPYQQGNGNAGVLPQLFLPWPERRDNIGGLRINDGYGGVYYTNVNGISGVPRGGYSMTKKQPIDLESDYDFETANKQFRDSLRLSIEKTSKGEKSGKGSVMREVGDDGCEVEGVTKQKTGSDACYDRDESFFDKISYRMVDNQNGSLFEPTSSGLLAGPRSSNNRRFVFSLIEGFAEGEKHRYHIVAVRNTPLLCSHLSACYASVAIISF